MIVLRSCLNQTIRTMRFLDKISSIMSQKIIIIGSIEKKTTGYYLYACMKSYVFLIWRSRHFKRLPFQRRGVTFACQWLSSGQSSWKPVLSHLSSQTGNDPVYLRLVYFTFMLVCAVLFVSHFRHLMYLWAIATLIVCMRYFSVEHITDTCIFTALLLKFC